MHRKTPEFAPLTDYDTAFSVPTAHRPGDARMGGGDWRQPPLLPAEPPAAPALSAFGALSVSAKALATGSPNRMTSVWAGLGLASAAYLGIVVWQQTQGVDAALVPVTESLERLASDIADLKQAAAGIDARERLTANRVAATEARLDGMTQVATVQSPPDTAAGLGLRGQRPTNRTALLNLEAPAAIEASSAAIAATPAAKKAAALAVPTPPAIKPAPAVKPWATGGVTPALAVNPVQTGSIAAPPVNSGSQGLMIASGPSLESIRLSWTVLKLNHSDVLGALEPRFVPSGDGSAFNLIAGPFGSDADAQKACGALKAHGVGCKATEYTGGAL